ncbi:peptidylprolyl isomerase [Candidatus Tenderia electrophaga]|uniref:Peptidyl-prolyl cis-trans isomerase n=1 Tax=Candidatus Tenderia electrophaga TaxID=1748243 RepID=A0A0S2TBN6_9GAMM|nr:peptidylprolyl isomerase [Candidatus Tenderia electrophaga]
MKNLSTALLMILAVLTAPLSLAADTPPKVKLETNYGDIVLQLNPQAAPKTVDNFIQYVQDGFYDGTLFHRVIPDFMIQGGGFTTQMRKKETRAPIRNEADNGLKNVRGSVAMARTNDPHSATAQFFINVKDNDFLNHSAPNSRGWGYAVFGEVVEGMATVDEIRAVATGNRDRFRDVPIKPVIIDKATLVE